MSSNLSLDQMAPNQDQKDVTSNDADGQLDAAITALLVTAIGATNVDSLTTLEFQRQVFFEFTNGGATAAVVITVPAVIRGLFVVENNTGQVLTITIASQPGAVPSIPDGERALLLCDGVDVMDVASGSGGAGSVDVLSWKEAVRVATTVNGVLATDYENGDTIDGVVLATGNRILLKDQTAGAENGIYTVNATGAPTRATDFDADAEVNGGAAVVVSEGTVGLDTIFILTTNDPIVVGTTALVFAALSAGGSSTFLGLTDTPANYTGSAGKVAQVNVGETALELVTPLGSTQFIGDGRFAPPEVATFGTAYNHKAATTFSKDTYGGTTLSELADLTDQIVGNFKPVPAGTWIATMRMRPMINEEAGTGFCGFMIRDSSTNKNTLIRFAAVGSEAWLYVSEYNVHTFSANLTGNIVLHQMPEWVQVEDDGTSFIFRYSIDGVVWKDMVSTLRTSWMVTPDEIGFIVNTDRAPVQLNILYYDDDDDPATTPTIPVSFTDLADTPATLTGQALKMPRVNSGETALEFVDVVDLATDNTVQTTDATVTNLLTVAVASGASVAIDVFGMAIEPATEKGIAFTIIGSASNTAGTTRLNGFIVNIARDETDTPGAADWDITVDIDDTTDVIRVRVTGEAATTIDWQGYLKTITRS